VRRSWWGSNPRLPAPEERDMPASTSRLRYLSYAKLIVWYIYQVYTRYIVYTMHFEIGRSGQNCDCNAAAHRFWIARVLNSQNQNVAAPLGIRRSGPAQNPEEASCKVAPPTSKSAAEARLRRRNPRMPTSAAVGASHRRRRRRGRQKQRIPADAAATKLRCRHRRLWWCRAAVADAHQVKPTMTKRKYCRVQKRVTLVQSTG
jgi:hypothetical protein